MPPRISPLTDACHHVGLKTDKTWKLEVKYINAIKGKIMKYGFYRWMDGWMDIKGGSGIINYKTRVLK